MCYNWLYHKHAAFHFVTNMLPLALSQMCYHCLNHKCAIIKFVTNITPFTLLQASTMCYNWLYHKCATIVLNAYDKHATIFLITNVLPSSSLYNAGVIKTIACSVDYIGNHQHDWSYLAEQHPDLESPSYVVMVEAKIPLIPIPLNVWDKWYNCLQCTKSFHISLI